MVSENLDELFKKTHNFNENNYQDLNNPQNVQARGELIKQINDLGFDSFVYSKNQSSNEFFITLNNYLNDFNEIPEIRNYVLNKTRFVLENCKTSISKNEANLILCDIKEYKSINQTIDEHLNFLNEILNEINKKTSDIEEWQGIKNDIYSIEAKYKLLPERLSSFPAYLESSSELVHYLRNVTTSVFGFLKRMNDQGITTARLNSYDIEKLQFSTFLQSVLSDDKFLSELMKNGDNQKNKIIN
jgi:hypothetical protein